MVQEINELRRELKLVLTRGQNMTPSAAGRPKASPMPPGSGAGGGPSDADLEREVAMQELALRKLEDEVRAREEMLAGPGGERVVRGGRSEGGGVVRGRRSEGGAGQEE